MRRLALAFGLLLVAAGAAGFFPVLAPGGLLLGLFATDFGHNLFHIATGLFGVAMAAAGRSQSLTYFRLVGIVFFVLAVLGVFTGRSGELMGMAHNVADIGLHAALALVALYLGFVRDDRALPPRPGPDLRGI